MIMNRDQQIEALAREILREQIRRSGWHPHQWPEDRDKRIEQDVDQHWHLMVPDARQRLKKAQE
jgi:primosomal protein N''